MIELNDRRRKKLRDEFKKEKGISPVIEFSMNFIQNTPRGYLAIYTHYVENLYIEEKENHQKLINMINELRKDIARNVPTNEKIQKNKKQ